MITDYGQVQTQEMPDSLVYTLEQPSPSPSLASYQTALDPANKNITSVNNAAFVPVQGNAGIGVSQPLYQPIPVPVSVPTFDFVKGAIFLGVSFLIYKTFFKRGRK